MRARIAGTGSYVPTKVLTNADLEGMVVTLGRMDRRADGYPRAACGRSR